MNPPSLAEGMIRILLSPFTPFPFDFRDIFQCGSVPDISSCHGSFLTPVIFIGVAITVSYTENIGM